LQQRVVIRPATVADAEGIAAVHVASWRTTYRGIVPDEFLDELSVERRAEGRRRILENPPPGVVSFVAETERGIVGFADAGPARDDFPGYPGELYAIYLLEAMQGYGIGRRLVEVVAGELRSRGLSGMFLWVLGANPARRFYEALGARVLASKPIDIGGTQLEEVAYGWDDLGALAAGKRPRGTTGGRADAGH
jgi:GNAT superfamily N-acetyltransferase